MPTVSRGFFRLTREGIVNIAQIVHTINREVMDSRNERAIPLIVVDYLLCVMHLAKPLSGPCKIRVRYVRTLSNKPSII